MVGVINESTKTLAIIITNYDYDNTPIADETDVIDINTVDLTLSQTFDYNSEINDISCSDDYIYCGVVHETDTLSNDVILKYNDVTGEYDALSKSTYYNNIDRAFQNSMAFNDDGSMMAISQANNEVKIYNNVDDHFTLCNTITNWVNLSYDINMLRFIGENDEYIIFSSKYKSSATGSKTIGIYKTSGGCNYNTLVLDFSTGVADKATQSFEYYEDDGYVYIFAPVNGTNEIYEIVFNTDDDTGSITLSDLDPYSDYPFGVSLNGSNDMLGVLVFTDPNGELFLADYNQDTELLSLAYTLDDIVVTTVFGVFGYGFEFIGDYVFYVGVDNLNKYYYNSTLDTWSLQTIDSTLSIDTKVTNLLYNPLSDQLFVGDFDGLKIYDLNSTGFIEYYDVTLPFTPTAVNSVIQDGSGLEFTVLDNVVTVSNVDTTYDLTINYDIETLGSNVFYDLFPMLATVMLIVTGLGIIKLKNM